MVENAGVGNRCHYCDNVLTGWQSHRKFCDKDCYDDFRNKKVMSVELKALRSEYMILEDNQSSLLESIESVKWLLRQLVNQVVNIIVIKIKSLFGRI